MNVDSSAHTQPLVPERVDSDPLRIPGSANLTNDPFWTPELIRRALWAFSVPWDSPAQCSLPFEVPALGRRGVSRGQLHRSRLSRADPTAQLLADLPFVFLVDRTLDRVHSWLFGVVVTGYFPRFAASRRFPLFAHVSGRLMGGIPRVMSLAIFAVAMAPIRHGGEVKPYATDLLVSLILLTFAIEWLRERHRSRWLWGLAVFIPWGLGLSYPAVFIAGGIGIGLSVAVWKTGRLRGQAGVRDVSLVPRRQFRHLVPALHQDAARVRENRA